METNTKDLFHNLVRFNLSGEYDFNIFLSFVQIVENAVGKVYYENLFLVYDAFNDLIQNYSNFKNLTMQNSSYLNLYNDCAQNLNQLSSQYKKSLKATVDELLDINYQENLSEKVEKLRRTTLTNWLLRQGYLQTVERDGRNYLSPTPKGEQSGIKLEQRTIGGRTFWSVVYHDEAQMLLLEHLRELCGLDG